MKNGVYFIVIAFLCAEIFKILGYANWMTYDVTLWTQNDGICANAKSTRLKFCRVDVLQ